MEYCTYKIRKGCETPGTVHERIWYCRVEGVLSIIHQNYYAQLCELDDKETKNIEIAAVGAGLGGGLDHTIKLKVMKFKDVMNWPNSDKWK